MCQVRPETAITRQQTQAIKALARRQEESRNLLSTSPKLAAFPDSRPGAFTEKHFSPAELGELWNLSANSIRRMFESEPGVLIFDNSANRRHRTLRIPESVAGRVYARMSRGSR